VDALRDRVIAAVGDLYEIEAEIGRGGAGVVYRARDVRLRRRVALKVLPPDLAFRPDVRRRFLREAETAAGLSHPSIVPIFSVDERDGIVYFVMALVEGESLGQRLRREPRPPLRFVERVLVDVADALAYAHARGVIHRDIKPDNILLDPQGRPLVTDFGIARALEADQRLTVTGIAVGTPAYMSPEQAMGEHEVDGRTDIYSLGVVGYQMLAGAPPFSAATAAAMLMKQLGEEPPSLAARRPDAPPALVRAVERALAKKRADRWPDAAAFHLAILGDSAAGHAQTPLRANGQSPRPSPARVEVVAAAAPLPAAPRPAAQPPAQSPPLPPFAALPAVTPTGWGRDERRLWKEQQRARQQLYREQQRLWKQGRGERPPKPERPIPDRIRAMRRSLAGYTSITLGLAGINFLTTPEFPWFLFPAMGMGMPLLGQMGSLWADGIGLRQVLTADAATLATPRRPAGPAPGSAVAPLAPGAHTAPAAFATPGASAALAVPLTPSVPPGTLSVPERVEGFRRRVGVAAAMGAVSAVSLSVGAPLGIEALLPVFIASTATAVVTGAAALRRGLSLGALGLRMREMIQGTWRDTLPARNPRLAAQLLAEETARLAPPELFAGPYGEVVRRAAADRTAILDVLHKLAPADRAMIPDVAPTVTALVERVASLAASLHRMEPDVSASALAAIEGRLTAARAEPAGKGAAEHERKVALLERQAQTMRELLERRATLLAQLESASLALQNVHLDLVKLRSGGIGSSLADLTSATQEARALSREIGYAIDAAADTRRI